MVARKVNCYIFVLCVTFFNLMLILTNEMFGAGL